MSSKQSQDDDPSSAPQPANRFGVKMQIEDDQEQIKLLGIIFVALLLLVSITLYIFHKPTTPTTNPVIQPVPSIASPKSTPKSEPVAPAPLSSTKKSAPSHVPAPASSTPGGMLYAVDSGLFQDRNNADALAARIPRQYKTEITPMNVHGRKLYRVRTIVPAETDANALATKLAQDQNLHARITPIHQP